VPAHVATQDSEHLEDEQIGRRRRAFAGEQLLDVCGYAVGEQEVDYDRGIESPDSTGPRNSVCAT